MESVLNALAKIETNGSGFYVAHHAIVPLLSAVIFSYLPGGHVTFYILFNSGAHVIVYGYYAVRIILPRLRISSKMRIVSCVTLHVDKQNFKF